MLELVPNLSNVNWYTCDVRKCFCPPIQDFLTKGLNLFYKSFELTSPPKISYMFPVIQPKKSRYIASAPDLFLGLCPVDPPSPAAALVAVSSHPDWLQKGRGQGPQLNHSWPKFLPPVGYLGCSPCLGWSWCIGKWFYAPFSPAHHGGHFPMNGLSHGLTAPVVAWLRFNWWLESWRVPVVEEGFICAEALGKFETWSLTVGKSKSSVAWHADAWVKRCNGHCVFEMTDRWPVAIHSSHLEIKSFKIPNWRN